MTLRKLAILPAILLALTLTGCDDFVANSAGVWPKIEVGTVPALSPDGQSEIQAVLNRHPEDAKKIIGRNNELVAKIDAYNKKAREHNRELYGKIRMDPKDIDKLEP